MALKIKSKLSLGLGFLFAVIILVGGLGAYYINRVAQESKEILKANYESIQYVKNMQKSLDTYESDSIRAKSVWEKNLRLQERNITEIGEKEATEELRFSFELLKKNGFEKNTIVRIRKALYDITDVNLQAILRKNKQAQHTADQVLAYIGVIGAICFLIVFTFIINFPGYIANPIHQLTESIKQIAGKNYHQRLHFQSNDEFGELADAFNAMAEKLELYDSSNLAKIMFEKKRIEAIITNMKDAIIGLNESRMILFVNMQATQLLGLKEMDLLGKYAPDVALGNDLMRFLLQSEWNEKPIKIFAEGKECYFTKENVSIKSDGKSIGEVMILKNITQFQELDLAKTNFIATISHELKTPIASIKLSSKLLEDTRIGQLNEEQKHLVSNIKDDSERLLRITSEVLNMAQVETGKIQLNFQSIYPKQIVDYAVDALKFQADQKGIQLEIQLSEGLPPIQADLEKTAWVMVNLLSNAIRYSPENETIRLQATEIEHTVEFVVSDSGKGIQEVYRDKIFDKFFQVPGSAKNGTGLGLAIAKEFITAQKGSIGLKNKNEKGSSFYFRLPLA